VFAVSTYFIVSLLFWYVGLIPDFASLRDRTTSKAKKIVYRIFSLGWRGSTRHWQHYEKAYIILAGLATPLVLSVHSVVSFDFAMAILPGWHSTIFPPYFVAGAIFLGFAMVVFVLAIVRKVFDLESIITMDTMDNMNKVILLTSLMVGYSYGMEFFMGWFSGETIEKYVIINRAFGPYAWSYWIMISCNVLWPQLFWFRRFRRSIPVMFIVSIFVLIGMWFERFVIIVTSLHRDFLPSSWGMFIPSFYDIGILAGSFGLFFTLVLLFAKNLPVVSIAEVKAHASGAQPEHKHAEEELHG
jgi:molybdopterin-containing oxidoreductase family membrane subunit